jgi:hypothetical protein
MDLSLVTLVLNIVDPLLSTIDMYDQIGGFKGAFYMRAVKRILSIVDPQSIFKSSI